MTFSRRGTSRLSNIWRPLALACVLSAALTAPAAAQTVVIRGLPPGSAAELVQGAAVAAGKADTAGDATLTGSLSDPSEVRVNIFVDTCEAVRRVVIVVRDVAGPAPGEGCTRAAVPGLFIIRPVSTIVVNLSGPNPSVLLRQGPFDFRRVQRTGIEPATGLMIFGGGGYSKLHNAGTLLCGDIAECPGGATGFAFGGGIGYWLNSYVGIEATYFRPKKALFEGAISNSLFQSTLETDVLMIVGKLGVPAGPVRIYGQGGATYHRAKTLTTQESVDGIEDRFELRTAGWGWTFGGGLEGWVSRAVALYAEGGRAALKGGGVETGGEGRLDERMTFIAAGLRISVKRQ